MLYSQRRPVQELSEPRLTVQDLPDFRQRLLCHVACLQGFFCTQLARPNAAVLLLQKRPPPEQPVASEVALLKHKRCGLLDASTRIQMFSIEACLLASQLFADV